MLHPSNSGVDAARNCSVRCDGSFHWSIVMVSPSALYQSICEALGTAVHVAAGGDDAPALGSRPGRGAQVLGRADIGHLAVGMCADLVLFDLDTLGFAGGVGWALDGGPSLVAHPASSTTRMPMRTSRLRGGSGGGRQPGRGGGPGRLPEHRITIQYHHIE